MSICTTKESMDLARKSTLCVLPLHLARSYMIVVEEPTWVCVD